MFPIKFNCFSSPSSDSWPRILVKWLGHLVSFCTSKLTSLIQRVSGVANERFSPQEEKETPDPAEGEDDLEPISPSLGPVEQPLPLPKDDKIDENQITDVETHEAAPIAETDSETDPAGKPPADDPQKDQNQQLPEAQKKAEPPQQIRPEGEDDILDLENLSKNPEIPSDDQKLQQPVQKDEEAPANQPVQHRHYQPKKKEQRRQNNPLPPKEVPKPPAQAQPKPPAIPPKGVVKAEPVANKVKKTEAPLFKNKFEPVECGGRGDCQLLSLLAGLKAKHPELAKDEKGKLYEHKDLRQMGVKFAREVISKGKGPYYDDMLGYLDSDRKEFNEDTVSKVKNGLSVELKNLDKGRKKISNASYEKKRKALQEKYDKQEVDAKANKVIHDDEEFLNRLEEEGFYCSTLHLFTLSILLKVPIYVHTNAVTPPEMFNPTDSKLDPVDLLHLSVGHYKWLKEIK